MTAPRLGEQGRGQDRQQLGGAGTLWERPVGQLLQHGTVLLPNDISHCPDVPLHRIPGGSILLGHKRIDPLCDKLQPFRMFRAELDCAGKMEKPDIVWSHTLLG